MFWFLIDWAQFFIFCSRKELVSKQDCPDNLLISVMWVIPVIFFFFLLKSLSIVHFFTSFVTRACHTFCMPKVSSSNPGRDTINEFCDSLFITDPTVARHNQSKGFNQVRLSIDDVCLGGSWLWIYDDMKGYPLKLWEV